MAKQRKEKTLKWKRTARNSGYLNINDKMKIIKPGQTFEAKEAEVPVGFRDQYQCLNKAVEGKPVDAENGVVTNPFEVRAKGDAFEVFNKETKVVLEDLFEIEEEAKAKADELNEEHQEEKEEE